MKHVSSDIDCAPLVKSRDRVRNGPAAIVRPCTDEARADAVVEIPLGATSVYTDLHVAKVLLSRL